jgi:hypothetical protein
MIYHDRPDLVVRATLTWSGKVGAESRAIDLWSTWPLVQVPPLPVPTGGIYVARRRRPRDELTQSTAGTLPTLLLRPEPRQ